MRLQMTSRINAGGDDPIFLMFHGYGNDESEMVRILDAVYAPARFHTDLSLSSAPVGSSDFADSDYSVNHAESAHGETGPSYISFRATYPRPYMGGNYWYPDGCGVEERQRECAAVGEAVTSLLDASAFANRKKILIGFSQGGYLSYRLVKAYPTVFDSAILLSPSFMGEEQAALDSLTRFFLAYGAYDRTIPAPDQQTAHQVLERAGLLTYREYPDMAHAICDEEIADIRDFLRAIGCRHSPILDISVQRGTFGLLRNAISVQRGTEPSGSSSETAKWRWCLTDYTHGFANKVPLRRQLPFCKAPNVPL